MGNLMQTIWKSLNIAYIAARSVKRIFLKAWEAIKWREGVGNPI